MSSEKSAGKMRCELAYAGMSRFTWSMVMPSNARSQTMTALSHALEQSYRLYARGRKIIAS